MTDANQTSSKKFNIYLDASVLISYLEADSDHISELFKLCKDKNYSMDISPFTIMEALGIKQEHRYFMKKVGQGVPLKHIIKCRRERNLTSGELREIYDTLQRKLKPQGMGEFYGPQDTQWWKIALDIVRDSNINASDAVHLGQALAMGSGLLVTTDQSFCKEASIYLKISVNESKLIVCSPEEAIKIINSHEII